jgi:molybdopterin synthase sulfur carrier subunit
MEQVATTDGPDETGVSAQVTAPTANESFVAGDAEHGTQPGTASVTVRYWAAIKAAAGTGGDDVVGSTVGEVMAAVRNLHAGEPQFARVLGVCSLLLRERPLGNADLDQVAVAPGDVIDVLPPFAGG